MTNTHISKEEIMVGYPRIAETIAAALPCELERVKFEASPQRADAAVSKPS